ncbi:filament-like plant protein 4 [Andrographis paniculata]|uniref:filament-like plant protein 4 n=1 Tax=Andrographis paniculata TaxID=175694 RepID=UPI0021E8E2B4|nr:filament-like plant protein 4 [Andrographis paniculata]XP_051139415.1 filament-like plant protein 4 [Andrographis paniculata]
MDKRSWPWKRKSSDKQAAAASDSSTAVADTDGAAQVDKAKQDNKKPKYVQLSMESYTHLTGLEDKVKSYEEQVQGLEEEVKELNEKLSEANEEMTNKENLVKQHAKVAEEAVSGWEKAEAEAAALKSHLESVTLLKLTAEDRASHLDGALKECMRQIRNLKEEHEQNLHEVVLNKTKLFDRMKLELETKIANLDQELMRSGAENAALSRSLQERSNMLIQLSEEKSQAEAEIERLKSNIESYEKEVNSHKYELHIARKEVEIRNEEKNMSVRSAEVANKQHLEGVKKIAKLEAECQRLRGLVRKKLPGPAALAQMKLEVESLGRDYGESRLRRSPAKPSSPHLSSVTEFSYDNGQKFLKENELLTDRLLAMEEETKMLKEALAKRNSELQDSRSICAQTASKLQSLEAQIQANGEHKNPLRQVHNDVREGSNLTRFPSVSEDGNEDDVSCTGSWSTGFMSEVSRFKKENNIDTQQKSESASHLDLMDDFLEMEKLAYLSNGTVSGVDIGNEASADATSHAPPEEDSATSNPQLHADPLVFAKLQSKVSSVLESISNEKDLEKVVEDIRTVMEDMNDSLNRQRADIEGSAINQDCEVAVSQIYNFVIILGKEAKTLPATSSDADRLNKELNIFSSKYSQDINKDLNLTDFVVDVSRVLSKASELHFNVLGFKSNEVETGSSDCIDKIALPENKAIVDTSGDRYPNGCATHYPDSASDPDVPNNGNLVPTSESTASSWKCSIEEFEQLKSDRDNVAADLARCTENFESTKSQLFETEQLLAEVKSQLTSAQKSNSLAETQLKCMAESYNSLESRTDELQKEVNILQGRIETLEHELHEEKRCHQETLNRCNDLQEQIERVESNAAADDNNKTNQESELAAAAVKLAECQETIFLLGKQLKALRPQTEIINSPSHVRSPKVEDEPTISDVILQDSESCELDKAGSESPVDHLLIPPFSPSDSDANTLLRSPVSGKYQQHQSTKSGSSSSASSTPTPEKRGFSRFFSSKTKSSQ